MIEHEYPDDSYIKEIVEKSLQEREIELSIESKDNTIEDIFGEWNFTTHMGIYTYFESILFNKDGTYNIYFTITDGNTAREEELSGYYNYNNNIIYFYTKNEEGEKELVSSAMVFIQKESDKRLLFILFPDAYFSWYEMPYSGEEDSVPSPTGIYQFAEKWELDRYRMTIIDTDNLKTHILTTSNIAESDKTILTYAFSIVGNKAFVTKNNVSTYYEYYLFNRSNTEYLFLVNKEEDQTLFALKTQLQI